MQANLHVEQGDVFIGNSAITNTNFTTTGPVNRLIFDNSANVLVIPNKIVLFSNIAGNYECGLGVSGATSSAAFITYDGRTGHIWYTGATTNRVEQMRLTSGGILSIGTTATTAKLYVSGLSSTGNTSVRIDSSNIALVTSGSGFVGFGTVAPTANLHVVGNVYVSNALQTTNVFVSNGLNVGPGTLGSNVVLFSNSSGGSNVFVMNTNGRIGIGTTSPGSQLDVYSTILNAAVGAATISNSGGSLIVNAGVNAIYFATAGIVRGYFNSAGLSPSVDLTGNLGAAGGPRWNTLNAGSVNLSVAGANVYASNAVTTTNVFASTVITTNPISFRNRVINGDFFIDQRNAGASSTPTVDPTRTIDRWKVNIFGSGRCQVGQNLGAFAYPTGFTTYYGMKVTTTSTVNAADYFFFSQVIEGVNVVDLAWGTASAKPVTLSFWVQSSLTGTAGGFIRNAGATAGNYTRSYPFTFTINNTLTWEYKTVTIPGDTTGQWISGQVDGIEFGIELWNGSTYQSAPGAWAAGNYTGPSGGTINYSGTLNSNMNITGVQIESGTVATPYERRHIGVELAMCQRYYEQTVARLGGYHTTGGFLRSSVYFNTKKRPTASPIFTVISTPESTNMGSLNIDNSNFDQSSARILASVTATGDAFGQWKVAVDCEF
jgi:hypothetical protein